MYDINLLDSIHLSICDKYRGQATNNLRIQIEMIVDVIEEYMRVKQEEVNARLQMR